MRSRLRLANVMALALFTLACDTPQPTAKAEWPPIVKRSPLEGADSEQPGFAAYAVWACGPGDSPDALRCFASGPSCHAARSNGQRTKVSQAFIGVRETASELPRDALPLVTCNRIILSKARLRSARTTPSIFTDASKRTGSPNDRMWLAGLRLHRFVGTAAVGNELSAPPSPGNTCENA